MMSYIQNKNNRNTKRLYLFIPINSMYDSVCLRYRKQTPDHLEYNRIRQVTEH